MCEKYKGSSLKWIVSPKLKFHTFANRLFFDLGSDNIFLILVTVLQFHGWNEFQPVGARMQPYTPCEIILHKQLSISLSEVACKHRQLCGALLLHAHLTTAAGHEATVDNFSKNLVLNISLVTLC